MKQDDEERKAMDKKWDKVIMGIKKKDDTFVEPIIPFKSSALIKDFNSLYAKIYDKEKFIAAWSKKTFFNNQND